MKLNPLLLIVLMVAASSLLLYLLEQRSAAHTAIARSRNPVVSASIKGKLVFKSFRQGVQSIRVDNDPRTFRLLPEISSEGYLFKAYAGIGDSILKSANANSIWVKDSAAVVAFHFSPAE